MTRLQQSKLIREFIDAAWHASKARIDALSDNPLHPVHAGMIEKNKGYIMACEDITEFILNIKASK